MHDPLSVAFEIKNYLVPANRDGYRPALLTIWHCDPDLRGDDDSCGWFIRSRHIDPVVIEKVRKEFEFNFKHNYWFDKVGRAKFSTGGLVLEMYSKAAWIIFMHLNGEKPDRKRHQKFMRKYLYDILHFAENPTDSIGDSITQKYGPESDDYRCGSFVSIITADIYRKLRPWYKHPRWHIHHWKLQFHPIQQLKRRYWDKCSICGKRGFQGAAYSDWNGTKIWHGRCAGYMDKPVATT